MSVRGQCPSQVIHGASASEETSFNFFRDAKEGSTQSLTVGTLNVNSIREKKQLVVCMMETIGVDILLLQETVREVLETTWPLSLPGC